MSSNSNDIHVPIPVSAWSKSMASGMLLRLDTKDLARDFSCCCIYRVHEKFHSINKDAYKPDKISIGPLHHHKPHLQKNEEDKHRYIKKRFSRCWNEKIEECYEAIKNVADKTRNCYVERVETENEIFNKMMVDDGAFAIELFYRYSVGQNETYGDNDKDYTLNLPIWARDMILMENQLPMDVLKLLYGITKTEQKDPKPLSELALRFFNLLMPREESVLENYFNTEGKHLLDLLRKTFVQCLPGMPQVSNNGGRTTALLELKHEPVPCATELRRAGVSFKKRSDAHSFLDIKFSESVSEMEIPPIRIRSQTESLLRNLIAYEHYCDDSSTFMASYAFMMCSLIQTAEDVALLSKYGIIENHYGGNHETICCMFNNLFKEVSLPNFYYYEICNRVNDFRRSRWCQQKAKLMRNKCQTLSVIIAIISTLFGILKFAIPKS